MSQLTTALCTVDDLIELAALCQSTFKETYEEYNTAQDMQDYLATYFSEQQLRKDIEHEAISIYWALYQNKPVGYIKLNRAIAQTDLHDPTSLEIERIYVSKAMQGLQIGKTLLQLAIEVAKQEGLEYLWLGVWQQNTNAIGFYGKQGFEKFGTHTFTLGQDEQQDDLMKLKLT